jgi:hypothetical protein
LNAIPCHVCKPFFKGFDRSRIHLQEVRGMNAAVRGKNRNEVREDVTVFCFYLSLWVIGCGEGYGIAF